MNKQALLDSVLSIVKRPDLAVNASLAINKAIRRMQGNAFYEIDRQQTTWAVDPAGSPAFDIPRAVVPGLRKVDYINLLGTSVFLRKIDPADIFCKGAIKTDIYYLTSAAIHCRLSQVVTNLVIGWYGYLPDLIAPADSNWITESYGFAIVDGACADLFNKIGDEKSAAIHLNSFTAALLQMGADLKNGEAANV